MSDRCWGGVCTSSTTTHAFGAPRTLRGSMCTKHYFEAHPERRRKRPTKKQKAASEKRMAARTARWRKQANQLYAEHKDDEVMLADRLVTSRKVLPRLWGGEIGYMVERFDAERGEGYCERLEQQWRDAYSRQWDYHANLAKYEREAKSFMAIFRSPKRPTPYTPKTPVQAHAAERATESWTEKFGGR